MRYRSGRKLALILILLCLSSTLPALPKASWGVTAGYSTAFAGEGEGKTNIPVSLDFRWLGLLGLGVDVVFGENVCSALVPYAEAALPLGYFIFHGGLGLSWSPALPQTEAFSFVWRIGAEIRPDSPIGVAVRYTVDTGATLSRPSFFSPDALPRWSSGRFAVVLMIRSVYL